MLMGSTGVRAQGLDPNTVAFASPKTSQGSPAQTISQPPARKSFGPEGFVSFGRASLIESESLIGEWPSLGAGLTLPFASRFALQVEANRMLGTEVRTVSSVRRIGLSGPEERFEYRSGTSSLRVASASLLYYFSRRRVQPFIGGGLSIVWREGAELCLLECARQSIDQDFTHEFRDVGSRASVSAGLRIPIGPHFSITPDVRAYASSRSFVPRASVAVGYKW
jgi:hypothetical protein